MATKHTDGCFQKAEDDEPLFTFLARDEFAPLIVEFWRELRLEVGKEIGDADTLPAEMSQWRHEERPHKPDADPNAICNVLRKMLARYARESVIAEMEEATGTEEVIGKRLERDAEAEGAVCPYALQRKFLADCIREIYPNESIHPHRYPSRLNFFLDSQGVIQRVMWG